MNKSSIEWTEQTWNPTTGCDKISAGCKYCYAETLSKRLHGMGMGGYENGFKLTLQNSRLGHPLRRKKPTIYFVNSMSDLFHKNVPFGFIDKVFETMAKTSQHIYQILTKRPEIMAKYCEGRNIPANVWLGVSCENKKHGLPRVDILRSIDCEIRFLSCEPLLEDLGKFNLSGIKWVIVGGESGGQARPMDKSWALNILEQCRKKGIRFFFKQWGTYGEDGVKRSKRSNGRKLSGKEYNEMPNMSFWTRKNG